jgi:hypothetical protein
MNEARAVGHSWRLIMRRFASIVHTTVALVLAVGGAFLAVTTVPKLVGMCQLRGWIPGARVERRGIRSMWLQTPYRIVYPNGMEIERQGPCWVTWTDANVKIRGSHRLGLDRSQCNTLRTGDPIELVWIVGNDSPVTRDTVRGSAGNFALDVVLLGVEATLMAWGVWRVRRLYRRRTEPALI